VRSRKIEGKKPMMKTKSTSGASATLSRTVRSGRRLFLGFDSGPKNVFCVSVSMYTAPRMTPSAAPTASTPASADRRRETIVPVMTKNSPTKPFVPGTPMLANVMMTHTAV
jgi:hypothetical protein